MSQLLKNAADSIQIGVEDFGAIDDKRHVSAVRNIYAGILLLYKHQLLKMSPPGSNSVLVKRNIVPDLTKSGVVTFVGDGKRTVYVQGIQKHFKKLKIQADWDRFKKVQKLRNDIEHYFSQKSVESIKRELFSHAFVLINDFICRYLAESPALIIGEGCWSVLLENSEVFQAAQKRCRESLDRVDWKYESFCKILPCLRCPECNSSLVKTEAKGAYHTDLTLICDEGNHEFTLGQALESAVDDAFWADNYVAAKDGGEPLSDTCPYCQSETYSLREDVCLFCEETRSYKVCGICGEGLSLDEQELGGLCGYHYHQWNKDG